MKKASIKSTNSDDKHSVVSKDDIVVEDVTDGDKVSLLLSKIVPKGRIIAAILLTYGLYLCHDLFYLGNGGSTLKLSEKNLVRGYALQSTGSYENWLSHSREDTVDLNSIKSITNIHNNELNSAVINLLKESWPLIHRTHIYSGTIAPIEQEYYSQKPYNQWWLFHFNGEGQMNKDTTLHTFVLNGISPGKRFLEIFDAIHEISSNPRQFGTGLSFIIVEDKEDLKTLISMLFKGENSEYLLSLYEWSSNTTSWSDLASLSQIQIGAVRSALCHDFLCESPDNFMINHLWKNEIVPNSDVVSNVLFHLPQTTITPSVTQQLIAMTFNQGPHISHHGPLMDVGIHSLTLHHICKGGSKKSPSSNSRSLGALDLTSFMALLRSMTALYEFPHHGELSYLLTSSAGPKALKMSDWLLPLILIGVVSPLVCLTYYTINPYGNNKMTKSNFTMEMMSSGLITIMLINIGQKFTDDYVWPSIMDGIEDVTVPGHAILRRLLLSKLSIIYLTYFAITSLNTLTPADVENQKKDKEQGGRGPHESSTFRLSLIMMIQLLIIVNIAFLMRHPGGVIYMTCAIWFLMMLLMISSTSSFRRIFRQETRFDLTSIASFITLKFNMTVVSLLMLGYSLMPEFVRFFGPSCEMILPKLVSMLPIPNRVYQFVNLDYVASMDTSYLDPLRYLPISCGVFFHWMFFG